MRPPCDLHFPMQIYVLYYADSKQIYVIEDSAQRDKDLDVSNNI